MEVQCTGTDPFFTTIEAAVSRHTSKLIKLSHDIHNYAEIGLEEHQSSAAVRALLENLGLQVAPGPSALPTAFRAEAGSGDESCIALLAEYDALPDVGHGCGHNVICAAAVGAFIGVADVVGDLGGRVVLIGTPAEESAAGKQILLELGAFEGIDASLAIHPWAGPDVEGFESVGSRCVTVKYFGIASHAGQAPWNGRNALDALVGAYQGFAAMRQHIHSDERIHGILTSAGSRPNIVPAFAEGQFLVRSPRLDDLRTLMHRVEAVLHGAAKMTGTTVEYVWDVDDVPNLPMRNNSVLGGRYRKYAEARGRRFAPLHQSSSFHGASTDMGNVSRQLPSLHPIVGIAPPDVPLHSAEFAAAAVSAQADAAIIDSAVAMANVCADFLRDSAFRAAVREEFAAALR